MAGFIASLVGAAPILLALLAPMVFEPARFPSPHGTIEYLNGVLAAWRMQRFPAVLLAVAALTSIYQIAVAVALLRRPASAALSRASFVLAVLSAASSAAGIWLSRRAGVSLVPFACVFGAAVVSAVIAGHRSERGFVHDIQLCIQAIHRALRSPDRSRTALLLIASAVSAVFFSGVGYFRAVLVRTAQAGGASRAASGQVAAFQSSWEERRDRHLTTERIPVELFLDYQCPATAKRLPLYRAVLDNLPAGVRERFDVRFRQYPSAQPCNPWSQGLSHMGGCLAGVASKMIADPGRRLEFERRVLALNVLTRGAVSDLAVEFGLGPLDHFPAGALAAVQFDAEIANAAGVIGTPAVLVDGITVLGPDPESLKEILDRAVKLRN